MENTLARNAAEDLTKGLGRRGFMRAVAALGAGVGVAGVASGCAHSNASPAGSSSSALPFADGVPILQPGSGNVSGDHYLSSDPSDVMWGYVPNIHTREVMRMKSGQTVTIDALSHEGILEDQGRNPLEYFGSKGVSEKDVLEDAIAVAAEYNRTERNFDKDGPHVVTGPVFGEGAQPGDVLKIETLEAIPRVPYGVVSSRHGKGALAVTADGTAPAGITLDEGTRKCLAEEGTNLTLRVYLDTFPGLESFGVFDRFAFTCGSATVRGARDRSRSRLQSTRARGRRPALPCRRFPRGSRG
ncbi:hypothetical protein ABT116_43490 [Streptomyces sp. NPDC002130]|uniref:hypothetical protein n=1 Tax=Streptomyces sp. NPDC002130 TaxID=3155568 RepID=UPI0033314D99